MQYTNDCDKKSNYNHITEYQRVSIKTMKDQGKTQQQIADYVGVSQSSISRELKRNTDLSKRGYYEYEPTKAQSLYKDRRTKANQYHNFYMKYPLLPKLIHDSLTKYSPDIIAKVILPNHGYFVSKSTLYYYIRIKRTELQRKLRHKTGYKKRGTEKKRNICPNVPRVHERPQEANKRTRLGDRECDSVVSAGHKGGVTTLTDRLSRFILIKRADRLDGNTTLYNMIEMLQGQKVHTITGDNGPEFSLLDILGSRTQSKVYLCEPYCSWQKGSNERNNRELRVFAPKGTDFSSLSDQELQNIQDAINHMPRKILGYKSAYEVHYNIDMKYT